MKKLLFLSILLIPAFLFLSCEKGGPVNNDNKQENVTPPDNGDDGDNDEDDPNAFETNMGHPGSGISVISNRVGDMPGGKPWKYEQWSDVGQGGTLTVWENGTFKAVWTSVSNYIVRVGYKYDNNAVSYKSKNHVADYNYVKTGGASSSFIGAYGWTVDPLIEWYIVDDWHSKPSAEVLGQSKGTYSLDGDTYTVFTQQKTGMTILGGNTQTFLQIFCVRAHSRQKGRINISSHFAEIEKTGVLLGKLYEVGLGIDVYSSSGGSIEYNHFNLKE